MAIIKACNSSVSVGNTGKECDTAMGATAMIIAIDPSVTFTDTDLEDPLTWLTNQVHLRKAFPMFGLKAPINTITNNNAGSDIIVTLDDGTDVFLRYALYNRMFETTSGGLCYAKALQSFNRKGYYIIEIDQEGKMLCAKNADGTYRGLITNFMYAPSPILADFKSTPYKNRFQITYSPVEMVNNGIIFDGADVLLAEIGLIDAEITKNAAGTTTTLTVGVKTECAETDLVAKFGNKFADQTLFVITDKADGTTPATTAAAVAGSNVAITGTFVSGHTYTVKGGTPAAWQTALIVGYDGSSLGVDIVIP